MIQYFIRRLLIMIPTLIGVSVIVFGLTQVLPGGPVETMIRQMRFGPGGAGNASLQVTDDFVQEIKKMYGYDKPVVERYFFWVGKALTGDFGESYEYKEPVLDVVVSKLPVSLTFGFFSFFLVYLISIPLGVFKARKDGGKADTLTSTFLFILYSIPSYALATLFIVFLCGGTLVAWFPLQGLVSDNFEELSFFEKVVDYLHHIFLPLICYVASQFALTTLMMKNSFLEQSKQDYVRTALAKGASQSVVNYGHILKNALLPIATELRTFPALFLSGSILVEQIFGLDGIGLLNFESVMARDYPVVLGIIMLASVALIVGVIISDLLYVVLDPRIEYK